jgi:hypothetical protein
VITNEGSKPQLPAKDKASSAAPVSKNRIRRIIKWLALIVFAVFALAGGCFIVGQVWIRIPQTHVTKRPLSLAEFNKEFGSPTLPASAHNIYCATARLAMGFAGAELYRFDAPVEDCLAYADALIKQSNSSSGSANQVPTQLTPITSPPKAIDRDFVRSGYCLGNLDWFDVETIQHGFTGRGPPSGLSCFCIDSDRGRFYYYWTD